MECGSVTPGDFNATCALPTRESAGRRRFSLPSEESVSYWLWTWPELLGWRRKIFWLFSPVVGRAHYPGDLWGLDSKGELLIVETKIDRGRRTQDPFEDFVGFVERQAGRSTKNTIRADTLVQRSIDLFKKEHQFLQLHHDDFIRHDEFRGTYPGVLPYSYHRHAQWYWPELYRDTIARRLVTPSYRASIESALKVREHRGNPQPQFFGLLATIHNGDPKLSARGRAHHETLIGEAGSDHVHLRAVRAETVQSRLRIHAWTPPYAVG